MAAAVGWSVALTVVMGQELKLKRLLALAKRSIDNSKQELADKDAELARLKQEVWFVPVFVSCLWLAATLTLRPAPVEPKDRDV